MAVGGEVHRSTSALTMARREGDLGRHHVLSFEDKGREAVFALGACANLVIDCPSTVLAVSLGTRTLNRNPYDSYVLRANNRQLAWESHMSIFNSVQT